MLASRNLEGIRVLLVEDDPLISLMFEDMLSELGCELVGSAFNLDRASDLAHREPDIDIAILDVHLGDHSVFPVASLLAKRSIPLLFSTGLDAGGLPSEWQRYPTIQKPITMESLSSGLSRALAAVSPAPSAR